MMKDDLAKAKREMTAGFVLLVSGALILLLMAVVFWGKTSAIVGGCVGWACGAFVTVWSGAKKAIRILEVKIAEHAGPGDRLPRATTATFCNKTNTHST